MKNWSRQSLLPAPELCAELSECTIAWSSTQPAEPETSFHRSRAGVSPLQAGSGSCEMSAAALPASGSGRGPVGRRQRCSMHHILLSSTGACHSSPALLQPLGMQQAGESRLWGNQPVLLQGCAALLLPRSTANLPRCSQSSVAVPLSPYLHRGCLGAS